MQSVNELLDVARKLGLPQRVVGDLIGVSRQQMHYYMHERNKPSAARAIKIRYVTEDLKKVLASEKATRLLVNGAAKTAKGVTPELVAKAIRAA